jgi:succinyl-CoA synthetase beta subunit
MKLLEHEGKSLLQAYGIRIPVGALWPAVPEVTGGLVAKAQVLVGGRGKAGGIRFAEDRDELGRTVEDLMALTIKGEPVHAVYLEQRLAAASEVYLAAVVDRDQGCIRIIASPEGGVDIESVGADRILSQRIDPFAGLREYQVRNITRLLGVTGEQADVLAATVRSLVDVLIREDAELVEVNPLMIGDDGSVIAADAKVVLDDDAMFRHPRRPAPVAWTTDSSFMQHCRELGAIGVDNRPAIADAPGGSVAILSNGAGSTMATYDEVFLEGLPVAGAIELHGALARGVEHTANVFSALFELEADVYLISAFYQLRSCDDLAQALVTALSRPGAPDPGRVVTRMRGVSEERAHGMVRDVGCFATSSLGEAAARVIELSRGAGTEVAG